MGRKRFMDADRRRWMELRGYMILWGMRFLLLLPDLTIISKGITMTTTTILARPALSPFLRTLVYLLRLRPADI